jgi:hypothetical protein
MSQGADLTVRVSDEEAAELEARLCGAIALYGLRRRDAGATSGQDPRGRDSRQRGRPPHS